MRNQGIKRDKTPEEALSALMRLCSRAEKSSGDAMRLMRTWGVEESRRAEVLDKLMGYKFIDDERYADFFVRDKVKFNGWGARKIRSALLAKGVTSEIADAALSKIDTRQNSEKLESLLRKKLGSTKYTSKYDLKGKLLRFALGRGYAYEDCCDMIDSLIKADE